MKSKPLLRCAALLVAILVLSSTPGCDSKSPTAPTLPQGPVEPAVLYMATNSGLLLQERRIVRQKSEYDALQEDIFGDMPPMEPLQDVDFDRDMVLAVASGEQPVLCHSIGITAASSDGTDLTVTVTETGPPVGCSCTDEPSQPVQVVRVPRADEVIFNTVSATACPD